MDKFEQLVILLASDIRFSEAMRLADAMVSAVADANIEDLVYKTGRRPDLQSFCGEFRAEMKNFNFAVPEDDKELYSKVVKPLASFRRWRSL